MRSSSSFCLSTCRSMRSRSRTSLAQLMGGDCVELERDGAAKLLGPGVGFALSAWSVDSTAPPAAMAFRFYVVSYIKPIGGQSRNGSVNVVHGDAPFAVATCPERAGQWP